MDDLGRKLDLDIVSSSWRSVGDPHAFEQMLSAWEKKLDAVRRQPQIPLLDGLLRNQLGSIDRVLNDRRELQIEDPLERAVTDTSAPAMVVSPEGLVVALNNGAADYFSVEQGMMAGTNWLRDDAISDFLAVRNAIADRSNIDYAVVRLDRDSSVPIFAEVFQLIIDGAPSAYTAIRSLEIDWDDSVSNALSKAFGMTSAECEVCRLLFAYRELSTVAEKRSVSLETVRTQVKRILGKIEVHSKTELMRFLALLCARAASKRERVSLSWSDPLGNEAYFVRKDGRKLAFSWVGAADGKPIIFIPGLTSFNFFPEQVRRRLKRERIKLLVFSLPGHGNSEAALDKDQLVDGCEAIEEWCEAAQSSPIPIIASRGAQYYVFRLLKLRPDLFSFFLCIGLPWNISAKKAATSRPEHLTLMKLSQDAPMAFELTCRIGHQLMKKHGPDFYWKRAYSGNQADVEVINNIEVIPLLRATVQHMTAQGYHAFKREQEFSARSPLPEWVAETPISFHWMVPELSMGIEDEDLKEILRLNPMSTLEVVTETGDLLPFQKPDLLADRIVALAGDDPKEDFARQFGNTFGINRSE